MVDCKGDIRRRQIADRGLCLVQNVGALGQTDGVGLAVGRPSVQLCCAGFVPNLHLGTGQSGGGVRCRLIDRHVKDAQVGQHKFAVGSRVVDLDIAIHVDRKGNIVFQFFIVLGGRFLVQGVRTGGQRKLCGLVGSGPLLKDLVVLLELQHSVCQSVAGIRCDLADGHFGHAGVFHHNRSLFNAANRHFVVIGYGKGNVFRLFVTGGGGDFLQCIVACGQVQLVRVVDALSAGRPFGHGGHRLADDPQRGTVQFLACTGIHFGDGHGVRFYVFPFIIHMERLAVINAVARDGVHLFGNDGKVDGSAGLVTSRRLGLYQTIAYAPMQSPLVGII